MGSFGRVGISFTVGTPCHCSGCVGESPGTQCQPIAGVLWLVEVAMNMLLVFRADEQLSRGGKKIALRGGGGG